MSRVIITLTDTPDGATIQPTIRFPQGRVGSDQSFAEAVAEDFLLMLQGRFQDFQLDYITQEYRTVEYNTTLKRRLTLINGGRG